MKNALYFVTIFCYYWAFVAVQFCHLTRENWAHADLSQDHLAS